MWRPIVLSAAVRLAAFLKAQRGDQQALASLQHVETCSRLQKQGLYLSELYMQLYTAGLPGDAKIWSHHPQDRPSGLEKSTAAEVVQALASEQSKQTASCQ